MERQPGCHRSIEAVYAAIFLPVPYSFPNTPLHHYPMCPLVGRRSCYADEEQCNGITDASVLAQSIPDAYNADSLRRPQKRDVLSSRASLSAFTMALLLTGYLLLVKQRRDSRIVDVGLVIPVEARIN